VNVQLANKKIPCLLCVYYWAHPHSGSAAVCSFVLLSVTDCEWHIVTSVDAPAMAATCAVCVVLLLCSSKHALWVGRLTELFVWTLGCRYCECFANGEFCNDCNCCNCFNNLHHEEERSRAVKACLDRNPHAFHPKIGESYLSWLYSRSLITLR